MRRRLGVMIGLAALVAVGCGGAGELGTAGWPNRPITMLVAFGAGGGTDANARIVSGLLERELGQPVNVVNRTGGGGVVGHTAIANAEPDGYTLGYVVAEVAMMHWAGLTDLTFEAFTPLAMLTGTPGAVFVRSDAPWESIDDVLDEIDRGAEILQASGSGQGGIWHVTLAGVLRSLARDPGAVTWVPHQGAAPALADLAAGGVDLVVSAPAEARGLVDAGRIRPLVVIDTERHRLWPDVPTLAEATGSDWNALAWGGVAGPAGLPADVVATLQATLGGIARSEEFIELIERRGTGAIYRDAGGFREYMAASDASFGQAMAAVGLVP
ncbi:MAG: tripartite tricarboxylate transporter substrate binding protein [Vicinamibacterales bacterium]|nr:tripartite tricarboxylate transporter substrate-binding protein [Acidobacteriota bacterium]MDP6373664.1 tripartite tricarboxylate transporter substrate binding protein [Vicinamibacterales bacterium]